MSTRSETWLWLAQRFTGALLAFAITVHLVTIIYAMRGGLSAAEILARTQGSVAWATFYGGFVVAAAAHGSIGLRNVVAEMTPWRGRGLDYAAAGFAALLAGLGAAAVYGVVR